MPPRDAMADQSGLTRRDLLKSAMGAGAALLLPGCAEVTFDDQGLSAAVAILRGGYNQQLAGVIEAGFALVPPPDVRGKHVLLKMNLVDLPREGKPIVTNPALLVAVAEAFRRLGAAKVTIGDGPALQRDAWDIVDSIGLTGLLKDHGLEFIDLNTQEPAGLPNVGRNLPIDTIFFSRAVAEAEVLVSVPKMKTHHWAGVSLAMKNLFGAVSSRVYGWPRNFFHLRSLDDAVLDFNAVRSPDYAIIDGITGLEGDGPVRGTPVESGVVVMSDNSAAADATAARVMGIRPESIVYLRRAAGMFGPIGESSIEQRGESIESVARPFQLLRHQATLII